MNTPFRESIETLQDAIEVADGLAKLFECGTKVVHYEDSNPLGATIQVGLDRWKFFVDYQEKHQTEWVIRDPQEGDFGAGGTLEAALESASETFEERGEGYRERAEHYLKTHRLIEGEPEDQSETSRQWREGANAVLQGHEADDTADYLKTDRRRLQIALARRNGMLRDIRNAMKRLDLTGKKDEAVEDVMEILEEFQHWQRRLEDEEQKLDDFVPEV